MKTEPRDRPEHVKEQIVVANEYKNLRLKNEDVAEFEYRPTACKTSYRLVVVRKNLSVEKGELVLYDDIRYCFYLSAPCKGTGLQRVRTPPGNLGRSSR